MLQGWESLLGPRQVLPAGQVLVLFITPPPQAAEHVVELDQSDQAVTIRLWMHKHDDSAQEGLKKGLR